MDRRGSQAVQIATWNSSPTLLARPAGAAAGRGRLCQTAATPLPAKHGRQALEYIHGAAEGAGRMERLITDLPRLFARGHSWRGFLPADLDAILKETLRNLQTSIESTRPKSPTMSCRRCPWMPPRSCSSSRISSATRSNSVASARRRSMWASNSSRTAGSSRFRDNGIGIEPQYFDRIFQIFQRLHTRKYYPGTGIGLAICKKMVERHGGAIWGRVRAGARLDFLLSLPETSAITQAQV